MYKVLLEKLASVVPELFQANCPVIMPIEYSTILDLKLDSHVIFYENTEDTYNLTDIFSVKGGTPIVLELGTWEKGHGVILKEKINRWDRRTDLFQAQFVNALKNDKNTGGILT